MGLLLSLSFARCLRSLILESQLTAMELFGAWLGGIVLGGKASPQILDWRWKYQAISETVGAMPAGYQEGSMKPFLRW